MAAVKAPFSPIQENKVSPLRRSRETPVWHTWASWALLMGAVKVAQCQFGLQCEEIKIPMCRNMPYNLTRLPNHLHHSTQENAQLAVDQFERLRWTKCSDQLDFFLCSMYVPICTKEFLNEAIPPCKSVCEAVREGCEPLLGRFNIPWPSNLDCSSLPLYDRGVCIKPEAIISSDGAPKEEVVEAPKCQCGKTRKLRKKVYKARHFHYAIRGKVRSVDTFGSLTVTTLMVTEVVKAGRVLVQVGKDTYLWTNRSCECPPLTTDQEYIVLGWEDFANSCLLYLDGSIAAPYRRRYVRKIKSWDEDIAKTSRSALSLSSDGSTTPPTDHSLLYPPSMQVANSKQGTNRRRDRHKKKKRKKGRRRKNRRGRKHKGRNSSNKSDTSSAK